MKRDVTILNPDGDMRAFAFTPDTGSGPWPAAIVMMDAPAIRPAMFELSDRLAQAGYFVVLPDLFWRAGPYDPPDLAKARAGDPEAVAQFGKLRGSTGAGRQMTDVKACLDWLDQQPQARAEKVGVTGYCMGGGIALRAAGTFPDRIAAAASFHGGNIGKADDPNSPHHAADKIKAVVYVGGAIEDQSYPPEQAETLESALSAAGVQHTLETYQAHHGWCVPDHSTYDKNEAERHWQALENLYSANLHV
jgi:carboxymethylenebutenolidase